MKNISKFIIVIILIIDCNICQAYFTDNDVGIRPAGMGNAFVGLADDINTIRCNSSGLAQLSKKEFTISYSALYLGLNAQLYTGETDSLSQHFIAYSQPIDSFNNVGVSWSFFNSSIYDENIITLNYARKISPRLYSGFDLKILNFVVTSNHYTQASSVLSQTELAQTDITTNLSFLFSLTKKLNTGLSIENIYPVDIGLVSKKRVPLQIRAGIAYKTENISQAIDFAFRNNRLNGRKEYKLMIGLEYWLFGKTVGIRSGYNNKSLSFGMSYRYGSKYQILFDYAFVYPLLSIKETLGSHKFAVSTKF